jgi:Tol biopolymer transport system component
VISAPQRACDAPSGGANGRKIIIRRSFFAIAFASTTVLLPGLARGQSSQPLPNTGTDEWYAYVDGRIAENTSLSATPTYFTDPELDDYKPVPSPDGSQIAFFRAIDYGKGQDITWKSRICVMNADGSGFRELTGGDHMDTNPQWTRDGSNKIIWTRIESSISLFGVNIPVGMNAYWTDPDAEPGEEERIAKGAWWRYEFVYSGLQDGRLLIRREGQNAYYLMTPDPDGGATYERLAYPDRDTLLHKITISPSETKIAYMKVANAGRFTNATGEAYSHAVIAYADFDADDLVIDNEVEVTEFDEGNTNWYASWTQDEDKLIFSCAGACPEGQSIGQIFEYDLASRTTTKISGNDGLQYRYPAVKGVVK